MKNIRGKVAVVTGAGSGIGRSIALGLANEGVHLALCDLDLENLKNTKEACSALNVQVFAGRVDVANVDAMRSFAKEVKIRLGQVDIVINNAGVALIMDARESNRHAAQKVFGVNFWGVVNGCEAFMPFLVDRPEAHIVNVASVFGLVGLASQSTYCASKAAVRGYTESLAADLKGTNISLTTVIPGGVRTNIVRNSVALPSSKNAPFNRELAARNFEKIAASTPEYAARLIIKGIKRKRSRVLIGADAKIIDLIVRLMPMSGPKFLNFVFGFMQVRGEKEATKSQMTETLDAV